jgi:purine-cytosine permease-like protein
VGLLLLLNAASVTGFCVIAAVVGGQSLSAISEGDVSNNLGISITCIVALVISFSGYKVLHIYERWCWIPVLIAIVITVGCGGSKLKLQVEQLPAEPATILSYGCLVAGFAIPFGGIASDFAVYFNPNVSR